jgi:hypothetical protein
MFGIDNDSDTPESAVVPVMMPKEVVDFGPQGGVEADELKLDSAGKLVIEKEFQPGLNLVGLGFIARSSGGVA